jgi:hypothetical protein
MVHPALDARFDFRAAVSAAFGARRDTLFVLLDALLADAGWSDASPCVPAVASFRAVDVWPTIGDGPCLCF